MTGARLQRVLNRAAYEDNVRRGAAGSAMTRALQGAEEEGECWEGGGRGACGYVMCSIRSDALWCFFQLCSCNNSAAERS